MKQLTSYNRVAGYLNKIFDLLNAEYFENELSRPTITIQSTPKAYGHFSLKDDTWVSSIGNSHEINIGAGTLARPIEEVIATLRMKWCITAIIRMAYRIAAAATPTTTNASRRQRNAADCKSPTTRNTAGQSLSPQNSLWTLP